MGNLYTRMKIFHFREKINSLPKSNNKILPPIHIRIKPTNFCNQNCSYCGYRTGLQLGKDMVIKDFIPKKKMMEIIDDLIDMNVKAVTFSGGGEPFCYPYLLETIKKLSKSPIKFACLTNGSMLDGELAKLFAMHGTWIRVSIDGWDDESYTAYRGVQKGEFSKIMKNIEKFKKIGGKCYLGIYLITDKKNASHIYDLIANLKKTGVNSVKIAPCIISNSGEENNEYHKPIFRIVKDQVTKAKNKLGDEDFEIFDSYYTQLKTFKKDYRWCPYIQISPVIGADLNVYSCHDKAYNLNEGLLGSIKNQSFKKFWFSDKNNFFKIDPLIHCKHHCMVDANNRLIFNYLDADKKHLDFV